MIVVHFTGFLFGILNMSTAYNGTLNSAVIGWGVASLLMLANTIEEFLKEN